MVFELKYTAAAEDHLLELKDDLSKQRILKDVIKALRHMKTNLRHPSLNNKSLMLLSFKKDALRDSHSSFV